MKIIFLMILSLSTLAAAQTGKGTISGTIRSADGRPAVGVRVAAIPTSEPVLASIAQTDANGAYRLENLTPGPYYVTAGLVDSPTYYPGSTTQVGASLVSVTALTPITSLDFALARPTSLRVAGRVTGPLPASPVQRRVTLLPRTTGLIANANLNLDGTFEFPNVLPGSYSVNLAGATLKQIVVITVTDKDTTGVELVSVDTETTSRREGLELAWSLDGRWSGPIGTASSGNLFAILAGSLVELDAAGNPIPPVNSRFPATQILRTAQFGGRPDTVFLGFGTWSATVGAYDRDGRLLWSYPSPGSGLSGIDDVWAMDLDGDKSDEVIIGFNGGGGVHVVNSSGQRVWNHTGIGNVWHVSAGDVRGEGKPQVVTTSAAGRVHVITPDGSDRKDLNPGFYANMVRVGRVSSNAPATILAATGAGQQQTTVAALSGTGAIQWSLPLESNGQSSTYSAEVAAGKPWFALGLQGGQVHVVDFERGVVIASIDGQGMRPDVTWLPNKESGTPLLIISTGSKLSAYRVAPAK